MSGGPNMPSGGEATPGSLQQQMSKAEARVEAQKAQAKTKREETKAAEAKKVQKVVQNLDATTNPPVVGRQEPAQALVNVIDTGNSLPPENSGQPPIPPKEPPSAPAAPSPDDGNNGGQLNAGEPQASETVNPPDGKPPETTQVTKVATVEQSAFTPPPSETVEINAEPVEDVQAFIQNDERLQKLLNPENAGDLVMRNEQNNVDVQKTINNIGNNWDKTTPAQRKLYYGLQEAQQLVTAAEGQRELDALKASGEDLTTPENRTKVAEAQKKIQDGQSADRTRAMRQKIAQSPELQDILRKNGIDPDITDISEIDAASAEVKSRKAKGQNLTSAQKDLLKKFDSLSGQTLKDVADKQLANATTPEEINAAVIKLAHAHESDKGQFTVWAEGVGSFLSQFSGEKLKQTRKDFVNYGRTLKQLKHELKEAKTDKDKERIQKSIDNASNLRIQALKEYVGKNILKWGVLLLVLGPIILSILTGLAAPKLLQFLGKAGGGQ